MTTTPRAASLVRRGPSTSMRSAASCFTRPPRSRWATRPARRASKRTHLALHPLTYDRRNDVFEVAVARGGPHLPAVLRHLVDHPARVAVDNHTMLAPMTIAVDGRDGLRTTIRIEHDPDVGG